MAVISRIAACFKFNNQAAEAVKFYTEIFDNSRIKKVAVYDKTTLNDHTAAHEKCFDPVAQSSTSLMTIHFDLSGQSFIAINTGNDFNHNEFISLQVYCSHQEELDYYWECLSEGKEACQFNGGWLKDKFGVSWQIVPTNLIDMIADEDRDKSQRVVEAIERMKKINISELKRAFLGNNLH